jgi:hypothetical protein
LKEIGGFIGNDVDDIIDGIISNKYKYHETLDFEESITIFKSLSENNYLNWPTKFGACKGCEFKTQNRNKMACFPVQTLLHKTTSMDGVNSKTIYKSGIIERT